jgi:hypothetical protein
MAQTQTEPRGSMPAQEQEKPGLESKMTPRPRYDAPLYKGAGKLEGKVIGDRRGRAARAVRGPVGLAPAAPLRVPRQGIDRLLRASVPLPR